jgi:outer membrane protein, multidrug efflux system
MIKRPSALGPLISLSPEVSSQPPPGRWWRLYDDPKLDALVTEALSVNTDLRVAEANLQRSHALLQQTRAARQPQAALSVSPSYQQLSTESFLQPGVVAPLGLIDAGVTITYEADFFGRLHRAVQAASADEEIVRAARDTVRVTVAADVTRAYADACGAGEALAAARRSLVLQQESAAVTARLVQAGRGTALDVTRTTAQVSQFQADIPALVARQRTALYQLAELTGRPPAEYPRDLASCTNAPRLSAAAPVGDGAAMLARRPDVREAERRLAADTYRIGVATGELYPTVTFGATAGTAGALVDSFQPETNRWGAGPTLTWRLNQSAARASIAAARAEVKADLARFDGAVLDALRETETALTVYANDSQKDLALQAVSRRAEQAANQAGELYRSGKTDFLSLLDAQRSLASAESALALSHTRLSDDQIAIYLALGGGWNS